MFYCLLLQELVVFYFIFNLYGYDVRYDIEFKDVYF